MYKWLLTDGRSYMLTEADPYEYMHNCSSTSKDLIQDNANEKLNDVSSLFFCEENDVSSLD